MTSSRFYFCAIPDVVWKNSENSFDINIATLVDDALGCESRIQKDVNLENEFDRYTLACQQIEDEVISSDRLKTFSTENEFKNILSDQYIPFQVLPATYLSFIAHSLNEDIKKRLGASFYPPEKIKQYLVEFNEWVTKNNLQISPIVEQTKRFFNLADQNSCGVVEVQSNFHAISHQDSQLDWEIYHSELPAEKEKKYLDIPEFETSGDSIIFFGEPSKQRAAKILREQIQEALRTHEPIFLGNQAKNDVITEVLHEFVFVHPDQITHGLLRIGYIDGSEAKPFPIYCLPRKGALKVDVENLTRAALMSMRHLELDETIDFCWFRNREVSQSRTLAETDDLCFKITQSQLHEILQQDKLVLDLYHTGFEPAIVGFYRGLVNILIENEQNRSAKSIFVTPQYYRGDKHEAGSIWA